MVKRGLCILLAVLTVFALAVPAFAAETSGKCGDNVKWSLSGGTLTISGKGDMDDYEHDGAPWFKIKDQIKKVVIKPGVTSIGVFAFFSSALTSVTIPESVTSIGDMAFHYCEKLKSVKIPNGVTAIGGGWRLPSVPR